jgi:hypothetical protein
LLPAQSRGHRTPPAPIHAARLRPDENVFQSPISATSAVELQRLPQLAIEKPDQFGHYFPDQVTFDAATGRLTHTYLSGDPVITDLSTLKLGAISLTDPAIRRSLSDEERKQAKSKF